MKFTEFGFDEELMEGLEAMRFENATEVQEKAIPIIMDGADLIACAQTGTGKTAAYLLPVINDIIQYSYNGIDTVILVPTRELAIQIDQQMEGFGYYVPVSSTAIYGGSDSSEWSRQRTAIEQGADIVISTPGRLLQHILMGYVDFSHVSHLILDEADRMLDMGFYDDIMKVVELLPQEGRQTLMFSATMPDKIRELAKNILIDPKEINIAISKPAKGIRQTAYLTYDDQKLPLVKYILQDRKDQSVIIFSSKKQTVKDLARYLASYGFSVGAIHSDLEQRDREAVLLDFKNRNINVLVATDVIARGIDIEKIDLVINYDVPRYAEDYVHRVGRTARANNKGEAFTFINQHDMFNFGKIEQLIEKKIFKKFLPPFLGRGPRYTPDAKPVLNLNDKNRGDRRRSSDQNKRNAKRNKRPTTNK
ncbi:MAG: DEAD/DEAH box helicase [Bacteroidales bacterium]|nr:DEAD/DEAH box helicase [Bacteroidales bacterium]